MSSARFKTRVSILYSIIESLIKHRNTSRWAKCCFAVERRVPEGSLGHPEEEMIPLRELVSAHGIHSEEDLAKYLLKTLPRRGDEVLLPQVNMKHKEKKTGTREPEMLLLRVEDELRAEVIGLKVMIEEVTDENKTLRSDLAELRENMLDKTDCYLQLQSTYLKLEERLEDMDNLLSIYSHQIRELREENLAFMTDSLQRKDELQKIVNLILPLLHEQRKEERLVPIEASTLYQEMVKKNLGKKYDAEMLDSYTLDWKSLERPEQPPNSHCSALSQLTSLCKRPPARKH